MSESDLDALIYDLLEGDTDRAHGQHILDAVAASEARRQGAQTIPSSRPSTRRTGRRWRRRTNDDNRPRWECEIR
jgi:hypothetical protein